MFNKFFTYLNLVAPTPQKKRESAAAHRVGATCPVAGPRLALHGLDRALAWPRARHLPHGGLVLGCWLWVVLLALGVAAFLQTHSLVMSIIRFCALVPVVYLPIICAADALRSQLERRPRLAPAIQLVSGLLLVAVVALLALA